jgi:hypothetical protein
MNSSSTLRLITIIVAFILLFFSQVWAQPDPRIKIKNIIADYYSKDKKVFDKDETTERIRYKRDGKDWPTYPGCELRVGDSLKVESNMFFDVTIIQGDQEQYLYFMIEDKNKDVECAIKKVFIDRLKLQVIEIDIKSGSLKAEGSGYLAVIKNGIRTLIGSKVTFMRHPLTGKSILFLEEGSVSFLDYEDITIKPDEIAILQSGPGQKPEIQQPDSQELERLKDVVKYNTEYPWAKPFPWYIPAGAVLIGGGVYLITRDGKEDSTLPGPPDLPQ